MRVRRSRPSLQPCGIYKKMTVWQNLAVFARIWKVPRERVEQVLAQVGLAEHKNKPAGNVR